MENREHAVVARQVDSYALRDRVINQSFVAISALAAVGILVSVFRAFTYGITVHSYVIIIATSFFLAIAIFRKKFSLSFKIVLLVLTVLVVVVSALGAFGFLASAKIYIALVPIYIAFLVSYRYALIALFAYLLVYLGAGHLYAMGYLTYDVDVLLFVDELTTWYAEGAIILLTAWGLLHVGYNYRRFLDDYYDTIKRQYKQLTENQNRYRALFESSNDAIILVKGRKFLDWNSKTLELFQCDDDYLRSIEAPQLSPEYQPDGQKSVDKVMYYFKKLMEEGPQVFDWQHVRPNGELFFVSVGLNLIEIDNSTHVQSVLRDISEKKANESELERYRNDLEQLVSERTNELDHTVLELQKSNKELHEKGEIIRAQNDELKATLDSLKETQSQLLQSEKMASLGILTAGVAHEINNPLNYIQGGYSGLTKYFRDQGIEDPDIIELLQNIRTGIDRSVSIVSGLNQFSRNNETFDEDCYIHRILDNCLLMLNSQLRHRVEIVKNYVDRSIIVAGNVGKIHQVFINLFTNAIQAIDGKGRIEILTEVDNGYARIRILDSGKGIPKEHLGRVADPFFTTKEPGQGTGLGLSISYSIVQEHKGTIAFHSELGKGTEVVIRFPLK